jgi:hypothetical protein
MSRFPRLPIITALRGYIRNVPLSAPALNITTDYLLGRQVKDRAPTGPSGKLRQAFEKAHSLPRHEQNQIVKFVEAYADRYASKAS